MKRKTCLKILCIVFIVIWGIGIKVNSAKAMRKEDLECDINIIEANNGENEYSESDLNEIISVLSASEQLYSGEEMQCYNVNNNEVITYIPIYDGDECTYVATCEKNGKLSLSSDSEFVEKIYQKFDNNENILLYINGNNFFAESKDKCCLIEKFPIEKKQNKQFSKFNLDKKINYMRDEVDNDNQSIYSASLTISSQSLSSVSDLDLEKMQY